MSEVLIFASNKPQYNDRLFFELRVQYLKIANSGHVEYMLCTQIAFVLKFRTYCGPVDARLSASVKDLPLPSETNLISLINVQVRINVEGMQSH